MMNYITILVLMLSALYVTSAEALPTNFVNAIHAVETGGKVGPIKGDNGKALGPLQIHRAYWQDATQFDKTIGGRYEDCAGLAYSTKVMTAYLNRYARTHVKSNNFEALARIHNGGPSGHTKSATTNYWRKVQSHIN